MNMYWEQIIVAMTQSKTRSLRGKRPWNKPEKCGQWDPPRGRPSTCGNENSRINIGRAVSGLTATRSATGNRGGLWTWSSLFPTCNRISSFQPTHAPYNNLVVLGLLMRKFLHFLSFQGSKSARGNVKMCDVKMCDKRMKVLEAESRERSELTKAIRGKMTLDTPREGTGRTKRLGNQKLAKFRRLSKVGIEYTQSILPVRGK